MKHTLFKALAATGAAALLLTACQSEDGSGGDDGSSGDSASENPVYTEMASWNACEVLDNLQPITDYMDIKGYGSSTAEGGEPGNQEIGNTFDPEAIGCGSIIYLGSLEGASSGNSFGMSGELKVKIIPTEGEDQAAAAYEDRATSAETEASEWTDAATEEFADPWDEGTMVSWIGDADQPNVEVVARDGQWVFHIQLYHTNDFGLRGGGDPALAFTDDELNQWFVDTYLPEVNQTVNNLIAEVQ
ncbi:hypothetical protein [Glycomyces arizonensis]|uniref:hypothetical protein n=1 Tax=Glycomyces arizonensis TaxID=256035 RepID=UPI0004212694|nr:hypothetical protein [Glycomyces arizonensis]